MVRQLGRTEAFFQSEIYKRTVFIRLRLHRAPVGLFLTWCQFCDSGGFITQTVVFQDEMHRVQAVETKRQEQEIKTCERDDLGMNSRNTFRPLATRQWCH